jgi:hypothetical protein
VPVGVRKDHINGVTLDSTPSNADDDDVLSLKIDSKASK